jgi:hypothetical protein
MNTARQNDAISFLLLIELTGNSSTNARCMVIGSKMITETFVTNERVKKKPVKLHLISVVSLWAPIILLKLFCKKFISFILFIIGNRRLKDPTTASEAAESYTLQRVSASHCTMRDVIFEGERPFFRGHAAS